MKRNSETRRKYTRVFDFACGFAVSLLLAILCNSKGSDVSFLDFLLYGGLCGLLWMLFARPFWAFFLSGMKRQGWSHFPEFGKGRKTK